MFVVFFCPKGVDVMGKGSFIVYDADLKNLEFLTDAQAGKLFKAIAKFRFNGAESKLGNNPALNILFNQITDHIALNEDKYKSTCEKKSVAMKKWWNDNERNSIVNHRTLCSTIEEGGTRGDNDNVNDNENDNVNDIDNDACGNETQNKRKNYYSRKQPSSLQGEPNFDMEAFKRKAIGLKYEAKKKTELTPTV